MKTMTGLKRQIVLSMSAVALGVVLLVILSSYAFYALLLAHWPDKFPAADQWALTGPEWAWMAVTTFIALTLAVTVAVKLSGRILSPLISVAESLRQVARGDLDARATTDDRSMGEAALLVNDFNIMAERLQRMAQEQVFWNAAIAHELRTPVTILRGKLQGLVEGVFTPSETQFRNLLAQVENLARLIEDLRVVGLADSGHLDLQFCEANLASEITTVVQLLESNLRAAGLIPVLELEDRLITCDPTRIRQVLLALLENARRYAIPGQLRIQTRIENKIFHIIVEDEGPGIAEKLLPHIFDAFQRGQTPKLKEDAGSGLGLAVVKAIALSHGGQATCRRSIKGGTIFDVSWPI